MDNDLKNHHEYMELCEFVEHFNKHYDLLLKRYARFQEINRVPIANVDVITYLDMIVVQLRAMCIESANNKNNYTAQVLLRKIGKDDLADQLDTMLDSNFFDSDEEYSIRKAIKTLSDRFICHYDNFDVTKKSGWAMAAIIEKQLRNPYARVNLNFIMKTLVNCIEDGLTMS